MALAIDREELLHRELHELKSILERIEALLEERLIGIDDPLPDETEAIREYENDKKNRQIELFSLEEVLREPK